MTCGELIIILLLLIIIVGGAAGVGLWLYMKHRKKTTAQKIMDGSRQVFDAGFRVLKEVEKSAMAGTCAKCGSDVPQGTKTCPGCGAAT